MFKYKQICNYCCYAYHLKYQKFEQKEIPMNIDKQEAMKRIENMQVELKKLQEIVNAPDTSPNGISRVQARATFYALWQGRSGVSFTPFTADASIPPTDKPVFTNREAADRWAKAIEVMLELRAQPGVAKGMIGSQQYVIYLSEDMKVKVDLVTLGKDRISPAFVSYAYANKAMLAVGQERIKSAIKTLAWID